MLGGLAGLQLIDAQLRFIHPLDETIRTHVGPVFLDIVETGGARVRGMDDGPSRRHVDESRP